MCADFLSCSLLVLSCWVVLYCFLSVEGLSPLFYSFLYAFVLAFMLVSSVLSPLLFYLLFESSLFPISLLLLRLGYQPDRVRALLYLWVYTLATSLPLLALCFCDPLLSLFRLSRPSSCALELSLVIPLLSFSVKNPVYGLHLWLPRAHVEASTSGSILLAALLLKLRVLGLCRFLFPVLRAPCFVAVFILFGGAQASLLALTQTDLKRLIAYSSVAHMAPPFAYLSQLHPLSVLSSILLSLGHGFVRASLFLCFGALTSIRGSRRVLHLRGLGLHSPWLALVVLSLGCLNVSCPPFLSFLSEVYLFKGFFFLTPWVVIPFFILLFSRLALSLLLFRLIWHGPRAASFRTPR